jgi:SpoVK/Ycf46/Vps4 family AAA+-type ATPase
MNPEYSYPGVYVEETQTQAHPIRGVSQSTLGHLVLLAKELSSLRTSAAHVCKRGPSFRVLFTGPNKKARFSAARALARELQLDLYRIDLSAVVNKYIGETEKNLRRLFDAAEDGGAILFFDEADALFGKRSEVKDSHDRYANIDIDYLLQRIEEYRGLAILTTNQKKNLDPALLRRLQFIIPVPLRKTDRPLKPKKRKTKNK